MCKKCNEEILSVDQIEAVSHLSVDTQNFGMVLRHLRKKLQAYAVTKKPIRNYYTHAEIPVGTKVLLKKPPVGSDTWRGGGGFIGSVFGSELEQTFFGDWLDMASIEYKNA